jgi:DNA polymerase-1
MEEKDSKDILIPNLTSASGILTNAAYGYFLILLKAIEEVKPKYIIATFDVAAKTFRHEMFEEYKATRIKAPDNLYAQIPIVKEILEDMNIKILEAEGYEADDVIGTVVNHAKKEKNLEIIVVTGDLDTLQLIDSNVKV